MSSPERSPDEGDVRAPLATLARVGIPRSPSGRILAVGALATLILIVLAQFGVGGLGVLWENLHWNVSALTAVAATALSIPSVSGRARTVRLAALGALIVWALGCASWSIEVALGSMAYPSTFGLLGVVVVVPAGALIVATVRGRLTRAEEAAVYLDAAILATAIAAGLIVVFGSRALEIGGLGAILAFLYPLVFLTIGGAGLLALVAILHAVAPRGGFPLLLGALTIGIAYLGWVLPVAEGTASPGNLPGHLFSVGALLAGLGAMTWTDVVSTSARYQALSGLLGRVIGPIAAGMTLLALLPRVVDPRLDFPIRLIVIGAGGLILLRQGLLLRERSRTLTELRRLHQENDRLVDELRQELAERARVQEQLINASRLAAVGELAAGVAHEVNNPLTGVLGYSEILLEDIAEDDPHRPDIETIRNEALRARTIVRALRDFARPGEPETTPTNLPDLITRTVDLVRYPLAQGGIIIAESHGELPLIELDPQAIQQVVLNVVTNALQAMPDGGTLRVESAREGADAVVRITDDGVGMDETVAAQAFVPFFSARRASGLAGLGLSVSLGLVESHRGTIELQSTPDVGTTVVIRLPIYAARATSGGSEPGASPRS